MSSETARRNWPREQPSQGCSLQVSWLPPEGRGRTQPAAPAPGRAKLPEPRLSGRPRTRPHEGRAGSSRPSQPQRPQLPTAGSFPGPTPRRRPKQGLLALAARSPGSCGTRGHSGHSRPPTCGRGTAPRLGAAPSLRRSFPAQPYLAVPQRCHGRPATPSQPSPERLRASQSTQEKGPGRAGAVCGAGRAGPLLLSDRRAERNAVPAALCAVRGPFGQPVPGAVSKADVVLLQAAPWRRAAGTGLHAERSGRWLIIGATQPAAAGRSRRRTSAFPRPSSGHAHAAFSAPAAHLCPASLANLLPALAAGAAGGHLPRSSRTRLRRAQRRGMALLPGQWQLATGVPASPGSESGGRE